MPDRATHGLSDDDVRVLRWLVGRVRSGLIPLEDAGMAPPWSVVRGLASAAHAAGATQSVLLADSSWTAVPGETIDAENPSGVEIPDATRLLMIPGDEAMIIMQAFICEDE